MTLKLYNTLTKTKEDFTPLDKNHVGLYVCGPTVYDYAHIGNARPVVVFDTLYRLLKREYTVTYVCNITDVDDKIIQAAQKKGIDIGTLTKRMEAQYEADMGALNALTPDETPRATAHIPHMLQMIEVLLEKGHAYEAQGHVLFDTHSHKEYGDLSGRDLEDMIAGARVEVAPYKKNPTDFVLWKPSEKDTPGWESPWGRGRPGWHIECSAMSGAYLGKTFDIHGGGLDLIFPHHENERAQSTCHYGEDTFAQTWMHNGMLMVEGKKMSKSLGNFLTVHDLLEDLPGEVIRLTLLSAHYRQPLDWTQKGVDQAKATLDRFYTALRACEGTCTEENAQAEEATFINALQDDLNTPLALARLHELCGELNTASDQRAKNRLGAQLVRCGRLLGILQEDPEAWFKLGSTVVSDQDIQALIEKRIQAKAEKNYGEADRIRADLLEKGVVLEDTPTGTTWKVQ